MPVTSVTSDCQYFGAGKRWELSNFFGKNDAADGLRLEWDDETDAVWQLSGKKLAADAPAFTPRSAAETDTTMLKELGEQTDVERVVFAKLGGNKGCSAMAEVGSGLGFESQGCWFFEPCGCRPAFEPFLLPLADDCLLAAKPELALFKTD